MKNFSDTVAVTMSWKYHVTWQTLWRLYDSVVWTKRAGKRECSERGQRHLISTTTFRKKSWTTWSSGAGGCRAHSSTQLTIRGFVALLLTAASSLIISFIFQCSLGWRAGTRHDMTSVDDPRQGSAHSQGLLGTWSTHAWLGGWIGGGSRRAVPPKPTAVTVLVAPTQPFAIFLIVLRIEVETAAQHPLHLHSLSTHANKTHPTSQHDATLWEIATY